MPYHFVHKMMSACVKESSRFMCNKRDQKFLCWYVCVCYFVAQQIRIFRMFVRLWKQFSFLFVQFFFGGRRTYKQHSFSFCELSLHLVYANNTNLCAMCVWVNALGANIHQKKNPSSTKLIDSIANGLDQSSLLKREGNFNMTKNEKKILWWTSQVVQNQIWANPTQIFFHEACISIEACEKKNNCIFFGLQWFRLHWFIIRNIRTCQKCDNLTTIEHWTEYYQLCCTFAYVTRAYKQNKDAVYKPFIWHINIDKSVAFLFYVYRVCVYVCSRKITELHDVIQYLNKYSQRNGVENSFCWMTL